MKTGERIAVLGGGLAGLTTAYELAERRPDCQITVYQMGWRLGGKVATSRNAEHGERIEEHGIHVLFGAYENAFHLLRRAYAAVTGSTEAWRAAFAERNDFTVMEDLEEDGWEAWHLSMARNPGDPGDLLFGPNPGDKHAMDLTTDVLVWLRERVLEYFTGTRLAIPVRWFFGATLNVAGRRADSARTKDADPNVDATPDAKSLIRHLQFNLLLLRIVGWIVWIVWRAAKFLGKLRHSLGDTAMEHLANLRRAWIAFELGAAAAAGLTHAAMNNLKIEDLDDRDLIDWLGDNGVRGARISRTARQSAPLRMVYEVVFAYEGGDPARPKLAAGTGLRDLLRLVFDRRGALAYTMRAGSAETMITPLYRALVKKNVRFEFFHRIDRLELSADIQRIERIRFTRQAEPTGDYDPLNPDGSWPDRPHHDQLRAGDALQRGEMAAGRRSLEMPGFTPPGATDDALELARDFDTVVLAIPVDALRTICEPLAQHNQRWDDMFAHLKTTPTQSAQLWFDRSAAELGWNAGTSNEPALLGAYAQPFGNWVDLSITIAQEGWTKQGGDAPLSVAYLCGPLKETDVVEGGLDAQCDSVRQTCEAWLQQSAPLLWPKAFDSAAFEFSRLMSVNAARGVARYNEQFFRANISPSDRYTLTLPGTTRYRLAPDRSGYENLYLAGDWTRNSFDVGAVEATVMSGRLAARAMLGLDETEMPIYGAVPSPCVEPELDELPVQPEQRRDDFIRPTGRRAARRKRPPSARAA